MAKQYITYEPIDWAQGVSGGTPLNASNLNRMENAIEELVEKANAPITIDDIGADAVGADQIVDGAVGSNQIADNSVGSEKLAPSVRDSLSRCEKWSPVRDGTDRPKVYWVHDESKRQIVLFNSSNGAGESIIGRLQMIS